MDPRFRGDDAGFVEMWKLIWTTIISAVTAIQQDLQSRFVLR